MTTAILPDAIATDILSAAVESNTDDDDLDHWVCCDPDVALCGKSVAGQPMATFSVASCMLCEFEFDNPSACQSPDCPWRV